MKQRFNEWNNRIIAFQTYLDARGNYWTVRQISERTDGIMGHHSIRGQGYIQMKFCSNLVTI